MAEGQVVRQTAAQDGAEARAGDAAPRPEAGAAAAGTGGAALGLIGGECTAQNCEDGRGAEVIGPSRWPVVKEAAAEAIATVAAGPPFSAKGLVAGERAVRDGQDCPEEIRHPA